MEVDGEIDIFDTRLGINSNDWAIRFARYSNFILVENILAPQRVSNVIVQNDET